MTSIRESPPCGPPVDPPEGTVPIDSIDSRIHAMLAVSNAIVSGSSVGNTLDEIAAQACSIASAHSASILELTGQQRFRIVGSHGLSAEYRRTLHDWHAQLAPGHGPSGLAISERRPVVVADFQRDPRFTEWASMPLRERWRALAAFPLIADATPLGTLVLYRTEPLPWSDEEIRLLGFVAEHAAVAVRTAKLIDEQRRQVAALERLVRSLREQAHEHANRLHAIAGFLILSEPEDALAFLQELTHAHFTDRVALDDTASHSALVALLRVEALLARHRGIDLEIVLPATLAPTSLSDAQAVTIVGNLLDNALEAVADMPPDRRRVRIEIAQDELTLTLDVRDWGPGLPADMDPFERGTSSKKGHAGLGLAMVKAAVIAAYAEIECERHADGASFVVTVPLQEAADEPPAGSAPSGRRARRATRVSSPSG
jgi:signal transduction histidine kinase